MVDFLLVEHVQFTRDLTRKFCDKLAGKVDCGVQMGYE